ncbi:MAG: hypothetical protein M3128_12405 [Verrucomicrobiota bacterium]|nr:hypothetical protein [Verrucomicrobiota bacterium]
MMKETSKARFQAGTLAGAGGSSLTNLATFSSPLDGAACSSRQSSTTVERNSRVTRSASADVGKECAGNSTFFRLFGTRPVGDASDFSARSKKRRRIFPFRAEEYGELLPRLAKSGTEEVLGIIN